MRAGWGWSDLALGPSKAGQAPRGMPRPWLPDGANQGLVLNGGCNPLSVPDIQEPA